MNKKGFTLVELLAVVIILGVISAFAIPAVTKYIRKTRYTAFDTMRVSACDAIQNKIVQKNIACGAAPYTDCEFKLEDLVNEGFLETLKDPTDDQKTCKGKVRVIDVIAPTSDEMLFDEYKFEMDLDCTAGSGQKWEHLSCKTTQVLGVEEF